VETGRAWADVVYVCRLCATDEHKGHIFIDHVELTNIMYVRRSRWTCVLMFVWLCSTIVFNDHKYIFVGFWPRNISLFPVVVAYALSWWTPIRYGRIASVSATHDATQFVGLHISRMPQYIIKCLLIRTQPMRALIDTGGGYQLGAPNLWSKPVSTFPSNILYFPLIDLLSLNFCQHLHKST
jgi:hypothetical protein